MTPENINHLIDACVLVLLFGSVILAAAAVGVARFAHQAGKEKAIAERERAVADRINAEVSRDRFFEFLREKGEESKKGGEK